MSTTYYVYIIKSLTNGVYYKGISTDVYRRLEEHNKGLSKYTSAAMPWVLVYIESHDSKHDALVHEKKLKKNKREYIEWLIEQPSNELKK
jgi:putative endonuclease